MKKFLALILILLIAGVAATEIFLPRFVTSTLKEQISRSTHAQDVSLSIYSSPNAKLAVGQVDKVQSTVSECKIGDVDFHSIELDAAKVNVDIQEILFPTPNLDGNQRADKILKSAESIQLSGIITQDGLKNFIEQKAEHVDSIDVKITPQEITATGHVKVFGRDADVDIAGMFILNDGDIYFHATKLDVRNTLVRNIQIDRFMGNVKVLESAMLPIGLKFSSIQVRDGDILINATR